MTRSTNRETGISTLEVVMGLSLLLLVATFATVFMRRDNNDPAHESGAYRYDSAAAEAAGSTGDDTWSGDADRYRHSDETPRRPDGGSAQQSDLGSGSFDDETLGASEPTATAARPSSPPSATMRAYFSEAFAVAGRPNWQRFVLLSRSLDSTQLPEAWSLLQEQPWSSDKQEAMKLFVMQWARQDPLAALDFAASLTSARQRHTVYGTTVETWATSDPEAALAWYEEQQAEGGRVPSSHFFRGFYASAPQMALEQVWLMEDPRRQSKTLRSIFLSSREEREQGADQLKRLFDETEDPEQRALLARMVAEVWAADAPMRDTVVTTRVRDLGHRDPAAALKLAESITEDEARYRAMASVANRWMHRDRTAAATAVLASSMPTEMKRKYAMKVIDKKKTPSRRTP